MTSKKIFTFFLRIIEKQYLLFLLYLFGLSISIYAWSYLISLEHDHIVDESGNLKIYNLNNMFGVYIRSIIEEGIPKINMFGMDFYYSMRPVLPYFLIFIFENISNNFFLILLIKNILMAGIIFIIIKNYKKEYNNLFLLICLILIFYNPHNTHTMYDIGSEEGFLNYFLIILFVSILADFKYKSLVIGTTLSLIFFTKESMFILTFIIPIIYYFLEKKHNKYLPLIMIVISNLAWGSYHYRLHNHFPIGPTGSAKNAVNLAIVYHKDFSKTYPKVSPDIYHYRTENLIKEKKIVSENN